jgi:hypothetical protein
MFALVLHAAVASAEEPGGSAPEKSVAERRAAAHALAGGLDKQLRLDPRFARGAPDELMRYLGGHSRNVDRNQPLAGVAPLAVPAPPSMDWHDGCDAAQQRVEQLRFDHNMFELPSLAGPRALIGTSGSLLVSSFGYLLRAARQDDLDGGPKTRRTLGVLGLDFAITVAVLVTGWIWLDRKQRERKAAQEEHDALLTALARAELAEGERCYGLAHEVRERRRKWMESLVAGSR